MSYKISVNKWKKNISNNIKYLIISKVTPNHLMCKHVSNKQEIMKTEKN